MPSDPPAPSPPGDAAHITGSDFVARDKNIYGDEVHGDKVLGDKLTITEETAYTVHGLANPYLGLRAFTYDDRDIYAGREQLAQEIVQRITAPGAQQSLLFITGASGSGKSSFAQAALIPLLETHYAAYRKQLRHAVMRPSRQPLAMLADALQKLHPGLTPETLATHTPQDQVNLLLVDQFEELFIQSEAAQRAPFCDFLTGLPPFAQGRTHVLATLRVDYLEELFHLPALWAIAKEGVELRAMAADDLRSAIQKPLQVHHPHKRFAPELLDRLLHDVGDDATLLPLLQVTLVELWHSGRLVLAHYRSLTDAIRQRAETVYAYRDHAAAAPHQPRPQADQDQLLAILLDLVNVSPDRGDRRDARQRRTLHGLAQGSPQRPRLVEELVNARLLAAGRETRNDESVEVVDIIHESLIDNWDRLRTAIEEQSQQLQRRARFKLLLDQWLEHRRDPAYLLLTEMQLAEAHALAERQDIELQGRDARDFYQRSLEHHEAERQKELQRVQELADAQQRRARTFRWAAIIATVLFLAALAATLYAVDQQGVAQDNANTAVANEAQAQAESTRADQEAVAANVARVTSDANAAIAATRAIEAQSDRDRADEQAAIAAIRAAEAESRALDAASQAEAQSNPMRAWLLAIHAGRLADTDQAFAAINQQAPAIGQPVRAFAHDNYVRGAMWSADETRILSWGNDTIRVWDAASGELRHTLTHDDVWGATWSGDSSRILSWSDDFTVRIWDAASGELLYTLRHNGAVFGARWSADETRILSWGGGTVRVWDAASGDLLHTLAHDYIVWGTMWSGDESRILSWSRDNTVRLWDAASGDLLYTLAHEGAVFGATWSADESRILSWSDDNTIRVWDAASGDLLYTLAHEGAVYGATWSGDESRILSWSVDNTVRVWEASSGELRHTLTHDDAVNGAKWSADESRILSWSGDVFANTGDVRVWEAGSGELRHTLPHEGAVFGATWSGDESRILSWSDDNTVRVWEAASGDLFYTLAHEGAADGATWSSDETRILSWSGDSTVRVWKAQSGQLLHALIHEGDALRATWSSDEARILSWSDDNTVRVWEAASGELRHTFNHDDSVYGATWSVDGRRILSWSHDGAVRLWDAATGQLRHTFTHDNAIFGARWSGDESRILSWSDDNTVQVWDADSGELRLTLPHDDDVWGASWSADESRILSWSRNPLDNTGTVRVWDSASSELLHTLPHDGPVRGAMWSADESRILSWSGNELSNISAARVWDAESGELLHTLPHDGPVRGAMWSADERRILSWSEDATVRVWEAESGELLHTLSHDFYVNGAIWNRDETRILSWSEFGTVRLWDGKSGELLHTFLHVDLVYGATWSADETRILSWSRDATVRVWDAATGQRLRTLTGDGSPITSAQWNHDETQIMLTTQAGHIYRYHTRMADLLAAACTRATRNLTWQEWQQYLPGQPYRQTCPDLPVHRSVPAAARGAAK